MSTLSFDKDVISIGRWYAEKNNISLSRLAGYLLHKATSSSLCLATALPFCRKKGQKTPRQKIKLLSSNLSGVAVDETVKNQSSMSLKMAWEDYTTVANKYKCIITKDKSDFYFSAIEVLNGEEFFEKYTVRSV